MKKILICSTLVFTTSIAVAEDDGDNSKADELIQELFLSEIVYPQDANEWQIASGVLWIEDNEEEEEDDDEEGGQRTYFTTPVSIEYGITDAFQIGVTIPTQYGGNTRVTGVGNIEIESLYNFYNSKESGWAFSAAFGVSFPRLSNEVDEKGFVFEPTLIGYKSFGEFALNLSAGVAVPTESKISTEVEIGAAAIYNAGFIRPSVEFSAELEDGESKYNILAAATILLGNEIELGFGVAKGLNNESPEWQAFSSLTWEFEI